MAYISTDGIRPTASVFFAYNGGTIAGDARAHLERGIAWTQSGAYEQALEASRQALVLAPDLAEAYAAMGNVYMALDCWQDAVRSFQQAIQAAPHLLECYYGLGNAYAHLGEFEHAIEAFEQGCQRIPTEAAPSQEAVVICREVPVTDDRPPETNPLQSRVRSDKESFDFSALLSSPEDRRQAIRQTENVDADPLPAHPVDASAPFVATPLAHSTGDNVQITESAPAPFANQEDRMADAPPARVADEKNRMADTIPSYFSEENVRIVEIQQTLLPTSRDTSHLRRDRAAQENSARDRPPRGHREHLFGTVFRDPLKEYQNDNKKREPLRMSAIRRERSGAGAWVRVRSHR